MTKLEGLKAKIEDERDLAVGRAHMYYRRGMLTWDEFNEFAGKASSNARGTIVGMMEAETSFYQSIDAMHSAFLTTIPDRYKAKI
jgi:hypothetical protein